jgi:hypothetical protein
MVSDEQFIVPAEVWAGTSRVPSQEVRVLSPVTSIGSTVVSHLQEVHPALFLDMLREGGAQDSVLANGRLVQRQEDQSWFLEVTIPLSPEAGDRMLGQLVPGSSSSEESGSKEDEESS